ncbi:chemotaxis protein CheB [Povalibacter sp.]|uniref:chemotaxis protein CheB n=1 Tax=Povalibacter sp. TaxID=1962978 RepID=UPI002F40B6AC
MGSAGTTRDPALPAALLIGGSAGALGVVRTILQCLPVTLDLPVIALLHLSPSPPDTLTGLLARECPLPVKQAEDKEPLAPGTVYVAPPGYHLLIESHRAFALSADPPVHYSRPSIDVLFESARDVYGRDLVAILLSGASVDGAAAMQEIHAAGAVTIVQTPASADATVMPQAALQLFDPTFLWTPDQMALQLPALLTGPAPTLTSRSPA